MKNKVFRQKLAYLLAISMSFGLMPWSPDVQAQESSVVAVSQTGAESSTSTAIVVDKDKSDPVAPEAVSDETKQEILTVSDARKLLMKDGSLDKVNVYKGKIIEGYIVGYVQGGKTPTFGVENTVNSNFIIADNKNESDQEKIVAVQLPYGDLRTDWNLKDNPGKLGQKIRITGSIEDYCGQVGLKSPTAIEAIGDTGEEPQQKLGVKATPEEGNITVGDKITLQATTESAIILYSVNNGPEKQYVDPITVEQSGEISITAKAEDQNTHEISEVVTFKYNALNLNDIRIKDIKTEKSGKEVTFTGTVARRTSVGIYVQDETGAIYVYGYKIPEEIKEGDIVQVKGKTKDYSGLFEIEYPEVIKIGDGKLQEPQVITIEEFINNGEAYESKLIQFKDVAIGEIDTNGETKIKDATGEVSIFKAPGGIVAGFDRYNVIALGAQHSTTGKGGYQLTVAKPEDVQALEGMEKLADQLVKQGEKLELPTTIKVMKDGQLANLPIEWNQEDLARVDTTKIDNYTVRGIVQGKGEITITVKVITNREKLRICDIQGKGHQSPLLNAQVKDIEGIVTALDTKYGFYIQSEGSNQDKDLETSEGIYVKEYQPKVKVGDAVTVEGIVIEGIGHTTNKYSDKEVQLTITQIDAKKVSVTGSDKELPKATIIGDGGRIAPNKVIDNDGFSQFDPEEDAIDFYESLEGMRVEIHDAQVVGGTKYYEIPVIPDHAKHSANGVTPHGGVVITRDNYHPERIILGKGIGEKQSNLPDVEVGQVFEESIEGIMGYNDGNFKMLVDASKLPKLTDAKYSKDPVTTFKESENGLRVASFNVENLGGDAKDTKIDDLTNIIVKNLNLPDVIGLEEVQDNSGSTDNGIVEADKVYTRMIESIKQKSGIEYAYVEIPPVDKQDGGAPGGNIRVGMIYRPDRVQLVEGTKGDSITSTQVIKDKEGKPALSLNPGRVAADDPVFDGARKSLATQFIFKGKKVFVIGNHLSSKGGDEPLFGNKQPAVLHSEVERIEQAKRVNEFVKSILAVDKNAKVVVLGDMNDFEFSDPVNTLEGNELYNMIEKLPENQRYTYNYQGNFQTLDNILVTKGLQDYVGIEILNINSYRPKNAQISDHDPVIINIDMTKEVKQPDQPHQPDQKPSNSHSHSSSTTVANPTEVIAKISIPNNLITKEIIDSKNTDVKFEAKQDNKKIDNVKMDLDAKLVNELNKYEKNLVIETASLAIDIPYGFARDNEKISVGNKVINTNDDKDFKTISSDLDILKGYDLSINLAESTQKVFTKPIKVDLQLPDGIKDKDKVVIYQLVNNKWQYIDTKMDDEKLQIELKNNGKLVVSESTKTFKDIQKHWAQRDIEILVAKQVVVGIGENNFAPKAKLTVQDFGAVLSRVFDSEKGIDFKNKKEDITRGQMAVMVMEAMKAKGLYEEPMNVSNTLSKFKDTTDITLEESKALSYMIEKGLLKGTGKNKLSPDKTLTRAEMSAVIIRLLKTL